MTAGMFAMRYFGALVSTSAAFGVLNTLIGIGIIVGLRSSEVLHLTQFVPAREQCFSGCGAG